MNKRSVTVVGAGVVGVVTALTLLRRGFDVTLIDAQDPGMGCSFGNAGLIARSSFMPLASPQTFMQVPGWLLNKNSPLSVRWRYLPKLLPWLLRYLKAGLTDDLFANGQAIHRLTGSSVELYLQMARSANCEALIKTGDYLQVYRTKQNFDKATSDMNYRRQLGFKIDDIEFHELQSLEPGLSTQFKFGHRLYDHAYVESPFMLVQSLFTQYSNEGGRFCKEKALTITEEGEQCRVKTDEQTLVSDYLVVACGAFSSRLLNGTGVNIPLETERGYHITCAEPGVTLNRPIMEGDNKFIATPMAMGYRFAGTVELAGLDAPENSQRVKVLEDGARAMLPGLNTTDTTSWLGFRPTLPDSLPVIGPAMDSERVIYAFGHQHLGLTCAPMTGLIVAALLEKEAPPVDISEFSAERF